ncbi:MAG: AAA family ATPase [Spirochaetales bacterium]|nr:AAA family ATPase [Spirochaetales bacterium]
MEYHKKISHVSASPTRPVNKKENKDFDIADLYAGPIGSLDARESSETRLDEKMRKVYYWIVNHAIITPFYDIEYNEAPPRTFQLGDQKSILTLPTGQSYSSFILMPLLNLVARKRCLLVGGPGRGKTASAVLMGLIAGYKLKEVKRAIQHGQPQMTISDLLGNPLPSDMMKARNMDEIQIAWRKWLGMKIKIIDEYNRIPTRTQSALLTVMGDNYAEIMDQIYECPEAAWYLTANDDEGGGTYQVIEALRDRIDIVVKALHFNTRFLKELLSRIENNVRPDQMVPGEIIFTEEEIDSINDEILKVEIPDALMRRIEFFTSQFEFFEPGGEQIEYKTKDNVKLSGLDFNLIMSQESGKDPIKDMGTQSKNGISVRTFLTLLTFSKALAYFRGEPQVGFEDIRNILPFVFHDKLIQNSDSPFFEKPENTIYRVDRVSWIRKLFDLSVAEFNKLGRDKKDEVGDFLKQFEEGLEGLKIEEVKKRLIAIERHIEDIAKSRKLYGPLFDDILSLKYLHQRYTNFLAWLEWKK